MERARPLLSFIISTQERGLRALSHRRVRAVSHLLSGTTVTLGITLLSIALTARLLHPVAYGILAMILTLGQATERMLSFQSWQPIIRYGASLDSEKDAGALFALLKLGLLLDLVGSVAAWLVATGIALAGHFLLGYSDATLTMALIFLVSMLFNYNGVATAIYRLTDQYRMIAQLQVANALLRLVLIGIAFVADADLFEMVMIWTVTQIIMSLSNLIFAIRLLPAPGLRGILSASVKGIDGRFPKVWRFALGSNFSLTIWSSAQQVDTLIVGWLADPASAGLFHIAKRISRVVQQIGSQVESVVYPDLSRLAAAGNRRAFVRVVVQTELILLAFGTACFFTILLVGATLMRLIVGAQFAGAAPLLVVQILAVTMTISGAASRAGLLALGDQRAVLHTVMACALAFYCSVAPLILEFGAMGANIAHLAFGIVWLGGLSLHLRRAVRTAPWQEAEAIHP